MGSYLIVANQTLGGEDLARQLRRVIESDGTARFVVLVPVSNPVPVDLGGAMGAMGGVGGVTVIDPATQDHAGIAARARLEVLLTWLRAAGVEAEGAVVGEPVSAMEAAAASRSFDEVIISTLPARVSQWLRLDLVHRAARRLQVPITTVTASDEAMPGAGTNGDRVVVLVGTSPESWEQAATAAVAAAGPMAGVRVAQVVQLDLVVDEGAVALYRAKVKVTSEDDQ